MKKIFLLTALLSVSISILLNSCKSEMDLKEPIPNLPAQPYHYATSGLGPFNTFGDNTPMENIATDEGIALGRVLFYDPRLSINNTVSCASCHKQQFAFADNAAFSTGFGTKKTTRNTPAIINAGKKANFFWDGRVTSLEEQSLQPVKNHIEMGLEKMDVLQKKLEATSFYADLFQKAFGSSEINEAKISRALSQFVRAVESKESNFDKNQFSADELAGLDVFVQHNCNQCHSGSNFGGSSIVDPYVGTATIVPNSANIGLDVSYKDGGVAELGNTNAAMLNGFFMIPSLRNVALTAPYMHDGRFATLEEVVEHYDNGIQPHPNLDPVLKNNNQPVRMHLTATEKKNLVAFMKALTDETMVHSPKFSNPFK